MADGYTVKVEQAKAAATKLEPASATAGSSASKTERMAGGQTVYKWGVRRVPGDFSRDYAKALRESSDQLGLLRDSLSAYVEGLRKAIETFATTDNDVKTEAAITSARADAVAKEAQRTGSSGSGDTASPPYGN